MITVARFDRLGYAVPFAPDREVEWAAEAVLDLPASADFDCEPDWDAAWDEPSEADRSWWARECESAERDWAEYEEWLDRIDTLARLAEMDDAMDRRTAWGLGGAIDDRDVIVATGCVG